MQNLAIFTMSAEMLEYCYLVILRRKAINASIVNPKNATPIHPKAYLPAVSKVQDLKNRMMIPDDSK